MRPCVLFVTLAVVSSAGCNCANGETFENDSGTSSGVLQDMTVASSGSDDESTGEPFDPSRWIGRYHFENPHLPFGERGDPLGTYALINFEILPDFRATSYYDDCTFEDAITASYNWAPSVDGWLDLRPADGETHLRFLGVADVETLRVQLTGSCPELRFELDGMTNTALTFRPGASCWVDKCTAPYTMQVDYCEGEEPEEACP